MSVSETMNTLSLESEFKSIHEKGSKLIVHAVGLVEEFVPLEVMERDHKTFDNKEVRFRHITPETDVNALIGNVLDVYMENEKINYIFEVWGYRDDLKKIQEDIQKGELSVSAGFKKTVQNGIITDIYGRELSVTPKPACTAEMGCGITASIVQNEEKEKMPEGDLKELLEKFENTIGKQNSERGERIVELEETITALEGRLSESNELVAQLTEKNQQLEDENQKLKKDNEINSTYALRMEIVKLEEITDEKAIEEEMDSLEAYSIEELEKTKARIMRAKKIAGVKAKQEAKLDNGSKPVFADESQQLERSDIDKMSPEQLAQYLDPSLRKRMQTQPPMPQGFNNGDNVPMIN